MRIPSIIDRYVIREVAAPAALGFVTYTFLLMMRGVFSLMEQVFVRGIPFRDGLQILLLTVPHVVVLTIPMSYLFGVLLAVGRMNSENELIALQAGGVSTRKLLRPIVAGGLILTAINSLLYLEFMPAANRTLQEKKIELFSGAHTFGRVEPRVFQEDFPNLLVYVQDVDKGSGYWQNVVLFDTNTPSEERLTLAKRGRMVTRPGGQDSGIGGAEGAEASQPWILLEDVVNHQFMRSEPETYRVNSNQEQLYRLPVPERGATRYRPGMRERDTLDLLRFVLSGGSGGEAVEEVAVPSERAEMQLRQAGLELHRRLSIPAASVVFALLGLPLGIGARSGGRGRGFILSIAVVLSYYVMYNNGELLATEGKIPVWLGTWLPNVALTILALILMGRIGRWLGERRRGESLVTRLVERWNERRVRRRRPVLVGADGEPLTGSLPLAIQRRRYKSRFPTLLDRYLVNRLLGPLVMVLLSSTALYVVVDLTDHVDEMAKNNVALEVILAYYWNLIPQVVMDVTPFALMIAVLILFTILERQQELTALKGAGISVFRLMIPVLLVAGLGGGLLWTLGESVVPTANREAVRLLDKIKGRVAPRSYLSTDRQWLLSRDASVLYNFLRYDTAAQSMIRFTMFRFDEDMQLRFHLFSHRVHYRNGSWIADSGWFRQLYPDGTDEFRRITGPLELGVPEGPSYFGQEYRRPGEMTMRELAGYIQELEDSGYRPSQQIVRWHQKFSYPLAAVVMVLLALPFGLNRGGRRVSTMQGVALALGLGIAYFVVIAILGKMGEAEILPPVVGAWAPVVLALLLSLNRMTTLRT